MHAARRTRVATTEWGSARARTGIGDKWRSENTHQYRRRMPGLGDWCLVAGGWWLVVGGWWLVEKERPARSAGPSVFTSHKSGTTGHQPHWFFAAATTIAFVASPRCSARFTGVAAARR